MNRSFRPAETVRPLKRLTAANGLSTESFWSTGFQRAFSVEPIGIIAANTPSQTERP